MRTLQVPRESIEVGSETIDVVANEVTGEERDRLYAIAAERIPQLAGDPGRGVGSIRAWTMARVSQPGPQFRLLGVKTILDAGVLDESVCCWSDGRDW
jgi:hypothetical protein